MKNENSATPFFRSADRFCAMLHTALSFEKSLSSHCQSTPQSFVNLFDLSFAPPPSLTMQTVRFLVFLFLLIFHFSTVVDTKPNLIRLMPIIDPNTGLVIGCSIQKRTFLPCIWKETSSLDQLLSSEHLNVSNCTASDRHSLCRTKNEFTLNESGSLDAAEHSVFFNQYFTLMMSSVTPFIPPFYDEKLTDVVYENILYFAGINWKDIPGLSMHFWFL